MENEKMTKKEVFAYIAEAMADNEMVVDFCNHEIELLERKASKGSGQTKTQKENEDLKVKIVSALREIGKAVTITDLQKENAEMAEYSNQKISALLRQLVDSNEVVKVTDKKKSYFSVSE